MNNLYFAQPVLQDSPDYKHLPNLTAGYTIDSPGGSLAGALQYYRIEAYARKKDRDAACGLTAHPDITYEPIADVPAEELENIGCGHAIGHPSFEKVLDPIFYRLVERLTAKMMNVSPNAEGSIAIEDLSIARTLYIIEAIAHRRHVRIEIDGVAVFEKEDRTTIGATRAFLKERLHLHRLPTLPRWAAH